MHINVFLLALVIEVIAVTPIWAQQEAPDAALLAQLEKRLAQSDSESKRLTGKPKLLWLLREAKIKNVIERLRAGQTVDPKELDIALSGRID